MSKGSVTLVGLAGTVYLQRIMVMSLQKDRVYIVCVWFWPALIFCVVRWGWIVCKGTHEKMIPPVMNSEFSSLVRVWLCGCACVRACVGVVVGGWWCACGWG